MELHRGYSLLLLLVGCYAVLQHLAPVDAQRFEFKHSFKRPFYLGRGGTIPFWEYGGSTVVSEDFVRLTPAMQSRVGWLWNTLPLELTSWEVLVEFEIGGGGKRGADGLALWYAAEPRQEGPVFGSKNKWQGMGVFFDTFDNDQMNDNPKVLVMLNDGTLEYDPYMDGGDAVSGSCQHDFREKPTKVKINYKSGVLQVLIESFNSWVVCATIPAALPAGYYFGLSAATGELTDNHDVYSFTTYNLEPMQKMASRLQPLRPTAEVKQEPAFVAPTPLPVEPSQLSSEQPQAAEPVHEQAQGQPAQPQHVQEQPAQSQQAVGVDLTQVLERLRQLSDDQRKTNDAIRRLEGEIARRPAGGQDGMMAEAFEKLLNAVADIKETSSRRFEQISASVNDIRVQMQRERETFNKEVFQQIHGIKQAVATVHAGVETAKHEQRNLQENLESNKQEIATTIERSTSFSMWTYILFFQACFAAAYVWWRKTTNEQKKWV